MGDQNQHTIGAFEDEKAAADAFDAALVGDERFSAAYVEVPGRRMIRSPFDVDHELRIDRVLIPSEALQAAGWTHGPVGVEIKASGLKLGPVVAQCIDYAHASFEVRPGFHLPVSLVFIFSAPLALGDLGSLMAQSRIGSCQINSRGELAFYRGSAQVLSLRDSLRNFIPRRKVGSR